MTTQYAVFSGLPTGLTLTKKVFTVADPDTEVTGITGAITERTNAKGQYTVAVTKAAVITGIHTIILFVGSTPIAIGKRTFAGTDAETAVETPVIVELDSDAQAMVTAFNAMRSGNVFTAPALANAPTGGSGSGSGARTVTITVNDGTTVLENCIVRLTEGANTFTALTNSSGVAVFNLDDATYTVGITKPGYTYSGTSLVVNGTETATYSMTAISISNPTAGKVARRSIPVTVVDRVT